MLLLYFCELSKVMDIPKPIFLLFDSMQHCTTNIAQLLLSMLMKPISISYVHDSIVYHGLDCTYSSAELISRPSLYSVVNCGPIFKTSGITLSRCVHNNIYEFRRELHVKRLCLSHDTMEEATTTPYHSNLRTLPLFCSCIWR